MPGGEDALAARQRSGELGSGGRWAGAEPDNYDRPGGAAAVRSQYWLPAGVPPPKPKAPPPKAPTPAKQDSARSGRSGRGDELQTSNRSSDHPLDGSKRSVGTGSDLQPSVRSVNYVDTEAGYRDYDNDDVGEPLISKRLAKLGATTRQSQLRYTSVAMLLCVAVHFSILTARLDMMQVFSWPIFIDFIPLWILPILVYLAAADFATSRVSAGSSVSRMVVLVAGFFTASVVLLLAAFTCLKLSGITDWNWTAVMSPLWAMIVMSQFFACFVVPGFVQAGKLKEFVVMFMGIWMVGLTALLSSLKLDHELPAVRWVAIFAPIFVLGIVQMCTTDMSAISAGSRIVCLTSLFLLGLQLDHSIAWPWVIILCPVIFVLMTQTVHLFLKEDK
eukprot:gnl/TRDRNA2_/TRDRNA2_187365_c0_seq1.p1 gnl/TRDRNA2_/TRDRNA2_187365_c0~~gnl/TRDRNA2_/TRDRNA2_187365_c0_seq1.p1  ORF type:complete len:389 (+),score=38.16 gnl/TRDRNA2_/TRDRNA2_187365_c0_seq1:126-1292(+)